MTKDNFFVQLLNDYRNFLNCLVLKDEETEAMYTTKYLEAEKIKVKEKPQYDVECLR